MNFNHLENLLKRMFFVKQSRYTNPHELSRDIAYWVGFEPQTPHFPTFKCVNSDH